MEETDSTSNQIHRSEGLTPSEGYLKRLCDGTFLSLWSYPNLYRDQGGGKELCDLLVVCDRHIIIFSDKFSDFPDTGDIQRDWSRWFKRAVEKSIKQTWGAERWIREHPDRIFLDQECSKPFPINLPVPQDAIVHRVAVAHGASERSKSYFNGGSGSLILDTDIVGSEHYTPRDFSHQPFAVGWLDSAKGYVHVLDDTTLDIVIGTLDTVSDFLEYLTKKEKLLKTKLKIFATGEEDLLGYYLMSSGADGRHAFNVPPDTHFLTVLEGSWERFLHSPQRKAQLEANDSSYAWDRLIETFNRHPSDRTLNK